MKILLLNDNPVISKLIGLSLKKMAYDFQESESVDGLSGEYDLIILDSEIRASVDELKAQCKRLIYLAPRNFNNAQNLELLYKPFLPTDFVNLFNSAPAQPLADYTQTDFSPAQPVAEPVAEPEGLSLPEEPVAPVAEEAAEEAEEEPAPEEELSLDGLDLGDDLGEGSAEEPEFAKPEFAQPEAPGEGELKYELDLAEEPVAEEVVQTSPEPAEPAAAEEVAEESVETAPEEAAEEVVEEAPEVEELGEISFDDLPSDAEFLGQPKKTQEAERVDFEPIVEEDLRRANEEQSRAGPARSAQDEISEELAELAKLDEGVLGQGNKILEDFKEEPILPALETGTAEVVAPGPVDFLSIVPPLPAHFGDDFAGLDEGLLSRALGDDLFRAPASEAKDEKIVSELSQSIAGAISSGIRDDTLKAALRGMKMNININISFNEK